MVKFTLKVNTKELESIIKSVDTGFKDFRKPFRELEKIQLKETDEAFKVQGRNIIWSRWKRLMAATTRQKIKKNVNKGILQRTGDLRWGFKRILLTKNKLYIWNKIKYFKFHQQWTKNAPQRQMLWHGNLMLKKTQILMNEYLLKLIQKWMK